MGIINDGKPIEVQEMGELKERIDGEMKEIKQRLTNIEELIETGNIRLESLLSIAIEREMITQDSFDNMYNLLIKFGKKKGWA